MRKRPAMLLLGLSANALAANTVNAGADKGLKFDVQPRVVSKSSLQRELIGTGQPALLAKNLRLLVTNPTARPLSFTFTESCGGLSAVYPNGKTVPHPYLFACPATTPPIFTIRPGQTMTFNVNNRQDISRLSPGTYFWSLPYKRVPFTLKP